MSNLATMAHPKKLGPTKTKSKTMKQKQKPPIKVVYISNPMKVKASASQFRALVQQLTGQDSELPADPTAYDDHNHQVKVVVAKGGGDGLDRPQRERGINVSAESSQPMERSACSMEEVGGGGYGDDELLMGGYGDELLMGGGDHGHQLLESFPVMGSEAFLWTWMC